MTAEMARKILLLNGVKNLKEFGYPHVNIENILTDIVYKEFFKEMLYDWKDRPREEQNDARQKQQQKTIDEQLEKLLNEIS